MGFRNHTNRVSFKALTNATLCYTAFRNPGNRATLGLKHCHIVLDGVQKPHK